MADVFISHAAEDREHAARLAEALAARGWSVWWDRRIVAGQVYDQAIEQALEEAKSIVVLWSGHSVASEWVRNEAAVGMQKGVLVPALIGGVKPPLAFRRRQTADLSGWDGGGPHQGFQALCEGIAALLAPGRPIPPPVPQRRLPGTRARAAMAVLAVAGIALLAAVWRPWPFDATSGNQAGNEGTRAAPAGRPDSPNPGTDIADIAAGAYFGGVTSDSKGGSRSDVALTVTRMDARTVRVTSDYARLGAVEVPLTRAGGKIMNAGGDTVLLVDPDAHPPTISYSPRGELAYSGEKR